MKCIFTKACCVIITASCLVRTQAIAQVFAPAEYPKGYFRDPLEVPISLAANFGELRADHYHMGLDIRTQHRENLPVLAAADGYIARIKVEPFGFGQAIYLQHPNGYTTVYGHLNRFFPALEAYVKQQQYRAQSWEITLDIPPSMFPVKKGQLIAYSGNRGGSQGPHLHFEIRSTQGDINCNPFLFGLPIADNTSPVVQRLACYDREKSVYEQAPRIFPVRKNPRPDSGRAGYEIAGGAGVVGGLVALPYAKVSFAIGAFDTQSGSSNPNGIYESILYDNERPVIGFRMDRISYENTRNINAHIDYRTKELGGPWLQHLSLLPGYPPPSIYQGFTAALPVVGKTGGSAVPSQDGVIDLGDGSKHRIRIIVRDAYANTSELRFEVQYRGAGKEVGKDAGKDAGKDDGKGVGKDAGKEVGKDVGKSVGKEVGDGGKGPGPGKIEGKRFYPGTVDGSESEDCAFYTGERSLYDTVHISDVRITGPEGAAGAGSGPAAESPAVGISAIHRIGEPYIPLLQPVLVRLRPILPDSSFAREKVVMVRWVKGDRDVEKPEWQGGWASARFRSFGNFQLVEDTIPPVIIPIGIREGADLSKASRIAFSVKDNLALRKFRAELDGAWLCFSHDKALAYIYDIDEHCPAGRHTLHVRAEDLAGNVTEQEYNFTR